MASPAVADLAAGEVRLWRLQLDPVRNAVRTDVLADDEWARADRFRRAADRERWIASRVFTREVLGRHVGRPPDQVEFTQGPHGKPQLAGSTALSFNVAHSAGLVVVAVTAAGEVGVDVEQQRDDVDVVALARVAFGDGHADRLAQLTPELRGAEFFRAWVRHEARVKCLGTGLTGSVGEPAPALWTADVDVAAGHFAAVAVSPREPRHTPALHVHQANTAVLFGA